MFKRVLGAALCAAVGVGALVQTLADAKTAGRSTRPTLPPATAPTLERSVTSRVGPTLSVAHHPEYRDATLGSAAVHYSTPAYFSMDQARSFTLFYSSGLAYPVSLIQVDAAASGTDLPAKMSLRVKSTVPNSPWITFPNGSTELFYTSSAASNRLSAQFLEADPESKSHTYLVEVQSWWADGTSAASTMTVRAGKVSARDRQTEFGNGWELAGFQRLWSQADGVHITENGAGTWFSRNADGSFTSPDGDFTRLTWDGTTWVRRYPDLSFVRFEAVAGGARGRMHSAQDAYGNRTTYAYDGSGRLSTVTDPAGKVTTFAYGITDALTSITTPPLRRSLLTASGRDLVTFHDPGGTVALDLQYTADAARGSVLTTYWTNGATRSAGAAAGWSVGYDPHGRLSSLTAPQVSTTDAGLIRPVARVRSLESAVLPAAGTGSSTTPAARVDAAAIRTWAITPRGDTTRVAVDRYGSPTRVEEPYGRVSVLTRNQHSQVTRTVAHSGHAVSQSWSGPRLTQVWDETTNARVFYEYAHPDTFLTRVHGDTEEVRYEYSGAVSSRPDAVDVITGGDTTRHRFNADGSLDAVTDPEGHGTQYGYSGTDRNTTSVRTGVSVFRDFAYLYDVYGRVIRATNPDGQRDSVAYDVTNRTVTTWNAANETTAYEYAAAGLWKVRDAKGQVYQFNRNALGWVESEVDPRGLSTVYRYDRSGSATERVNRRGQTLRSTYDKLGRVLTVTDVSTGAVTSYAYAADDRWMRVSNGESTDTIRYDAAGRATGHTTVRAGVRYAFSSAYDARGVRTALTMTAPWSRSVAFHYGLQMRLDSVRDLSGGVTKLQYNDDGQLWRTILPGVSLGAMANEYPSTHVNARTTFSVPALNDSLGAAYTQDRQGRTEARYTSDLATVKRFSYDLAGRLEGYSRASRISGAECQVTSTFHPDFGVLTDVQPVSPWGECDPATEYFPDHEVYYQYDAVGNRTDSGMGATYQAGTNLLLSFGGYTLQYDNDGNLTSKTGNGLTQTFTWNAYGQLVSMKKNGQTTTYGYDGFGRRVRKSTPTQTIRYVYDGDDLFMEVDGSGTILREYTYYPGVDRPLSLRTGGQTYYYVTEAPGHVTALLNTQGAIVNQYAYGPWGALESSRETVANAIRYTAREYDAESGLYYYRARYYDSQFGRFISEDPIGLAGGINPYAYSENDPVNRADPFGLCSYLYYYQYYYEKRGGQLVKVVIPESVVKIGEIDCDKGERPEIGKGGGSSGRYGTLLQCGVSGHVATGEWPGETHTGKSEALTAKHCRAIAKGLRFLLRHPLTVCRDMGSAAAHVFQQNKVVYSATFPYFGAWLGEDGMMLGRASFLPSTRVNTSGTQVAAAMAEELAHKFYGPLHRNEGFDGPMAPDEIGNMCHYAPL